MEMIVGPAILKMEIEIGIGLAEILVLAGIVVVGGAFVLIYWLSGKSDNDRSE